MDTRLLLAVVIFLSPGVLVTSSKVKYCAIRIDQYYFLGLCVSICFEGSTSEVLVSTNLNHWYCSIRHMLIGMSAFSGNSVATTKCVAEGVACVLYIFRKDVDSTAVYRTLKDFTRLSSMRGSTDLLRGRR